METIKLPLEVLREATWNTNQMDDAMMQRLRSSIKNFGLVHNLVVRPLGEKYEVLSGNQRLKLLRELKVKTVPCVIVDSDDAHARLLAQVLNNIHGDDDLVLKAALIREVMQAMAGKDVIVKFGRGLPGTDVGGQEFKLLPPTGRAGAGLALGQKFRV